VNESIKRRERKRQVVIMPDIEPEENPNEDAEVDDEVEV
jgi:hypothetical protein